MKQKIYCYNLYLFSDKDKPSYYLSELEGMKLIMVLSNKECPKFIVIQNELINISAIKRLEREPHYIPGMIKNTVIIDGKQEILERYGNIHEERDLKDDEMVVYQKFSELMSNGRDVKYIDMSFEKPHYIQKDVFS